MSAPLKRLVKKVADNTIVRMVNYVATRVRASHLNVIEVMIEKALSDSAEYAESEMKDALYFRSKEELWDFALSKIEVDGMAAEFVESPRLQYEYLGFAKEQVAIKVKGVQASRPANRSVGTA